MTGEKRRLYVGIDVHSRQHKVALLPLDLLEHPGNLWQKVKPLAITNESQDFKQLDLAIQAHISTTDEAIIAVDHTGGHYSEPLVHFLHSRGYNVCYLETKAVRGARDHLLDQESKSDDIDAIGAAYLLYLRDMHQLSFRISTAVPQLQSEASTLNTLILQRLQFNKLINQITNRLHQLLLAVFPEGEAHFFKDLLKIAPHYSTPADILNSDGLQTIEDVRPEVKDKLVVLAGRTVGIPGDMYKWLIKELAIQRMELLVKRDFLTVATKKEVAAHPYSEILLSFPFIGDVIAATLISVIKDINRWPDKKKLRKALGVYNSLTQSGLNTGRSRRGTEGNKHGRRALFHACFGCIRTYAPDNDFKDYYLRQVARGKPRMKALVSTMGKLAEIIFYCLKAQKPYRYQGKYKANQFPNHKNLRK